MVNNIFGFGWNPGFFLAKQGIFHHE